jgi:hypothetical protein
MLPPLDCFAAAYRRSSLHTCVESQLLSTPVYLILLRALCVGICCSVWSLLIRQNYLAMQAILNKGLNDSSDAKKQR